MNNDIIDSAYAKALNNNPQQSNNSGKSYSNISGVVTAIKDGVTKKGVKFTQATIQTLADSDNRDIENGKKSFINILHQRNRNTERADENGNMQKVDNGDNFIYKVGEIIAVSGYTTTNTYEKDGVKKTSTTLHPLSVKSSDKIYNITNIKNAYLANDVQIKEGESYKFAEVSIAVTNKYKTSEPKTDFMNLTIDSKLPLFKEVENLKKGDKVDIDGVCLNPDSYGIKLKGNSASKIEVISTKQERELQASTQEHSR